MGNQLKLFGNQEAPACGDVLGLCGVPGLNYYPNFLGDSEQSHVLGEIDSRPWQGDLKRRVQHYGYKYDYKARRVDPTMYVGALPEFAIEVAKKMLTKRIVNELPDQVIVNEYQPGQGITAHVDCEPCFKDTIVTISLGSTYAMDFFSTTSDTEHSFDLALGSALVLSGDARSLWKHGIKHRKTDNGRKRGRRVSLTYRNVILQES